MTHNIDRFIDETLDCIWEIKQIWIEYDARHKLRKYKRLGLVKFENNV